MLRLAVPVAGSLVLLTAAQNDDMNDDDDEQETDLSWMWPWDRAEGATNLARVRAERAAREKAEKAAAAEAEAAKPQGEAAKEDVAWQRRK